VREGDMNGVVRIFSRVVYQTSFVKIQSGVSKRDDSVLCRNRSDAKRGIVVLDLEDEGSRKSEGNW